MKVAVIGGGAAGITAAFLLDKAHDITLFEKRPILGGNVRTLNKNVTNVDLTSHLKIDNGVIEFQRDHFVNFHKLMDKLGVATEVIDGGATSLYLNNGKVVYSPGIAEKLPLWQQVRNYGRLLPMAIASRRFLQQANQADAGKNKPVSAFIDNSAWGRWQKMLLMYGYSIPYWQIDDFPAEVAFSILRDTEPGSRWTRVVDGVYTYFEKILESFRGTIHTDV
ncbi:MAG: NAD(P)-binding protein, partial [Chloroflexota bacterium]